MCILLAMDFLTLELFFNLDHFMHKSLWIESLPVWSALHKLKDYLNSYSLGRIEIEIPPNVYLKNPELISIGKGTVIEPGAMIIGPCIIGENCVIAHCAYIREYIILGDHCSIGHSAELKHSILLDGSAVTHFCYVGDSIIGNGVNLGAGVKCANLRLDRGEVLAGLKKISSGLKKFGAIVGDGAQIGCNSVINPGTLIGKGAICYPLQNIGGTIV